MRAFTTFTQAHRQHLPAVTVAAILSASLVFAVQLAMPQPAVAAHPDAPVITSFSLKEVSPGAWTISGTVTASEGLEGMVLYFGGLVDTTDAPLADGSFSVSVSAEPMPGDWATVYAIDRFELQSDTVTEYF